MAALFAGLAGLEKTAAVLLYIGIVMSVVATVEYYLSAKRQVAERRV
jgi:hypothetical protein